MVGLLLALAQGANACSCFRDPPNSTPWSRATAAAAGSDAVFAGKVLAVATGIEVMGDDEDDVWPRRHFTFEVSQQYRGHVQPKTIISTGFGGGDCGFEFEIGDTYLVYADIEDNGALETSICHRTRHIKYAGTDLRYLRGEQPVTDDLVVETNESTEQGKPGVTLCGTVGYAANRSVDGAEVRLWRILSDGRREEEESVQAEQSGNYCFKSVDSGRFLVSAVEEMEEPEDSDEGPPASFRYAPLAGAYGGLQNPVEIAVSGKEELRKLDFTLISLPGLNVSGRVAFDGTMPQADLFVSLRSNNQELFRHWQMLRLQPGREFMFEGVPAGSYSVDVLFLDRAWEDWIAPAVQIDLKENLEGLPVPLERKSPR